MKRLGVVVLGLVFLCCFGVTVNATPMEDGILWEISGEGFHSETGNEVFFSGSGMGMVGGTASVDIYYEVYDKGLGGLPRQVIGQVSLNFMTTGIGLCITDFGMSTAMEFGLKSNVAGLDIYTLNACVSNYSFTGYPNAMITGVNVGGDGLSTNVMGVLGEGPNSVCLYNPAGTFNVMGTKCATATFVVDMGQPEIPEPTTMALLGAGAVSLIAKRRRVA
ncbi:MAG: PEP-CTERM sorting domain-containing protein [Candidatus Omnitrophica bacterium]|nr:PEP-CTERM sorting domain-containing protein [Candidatus Omnitrophota bacterium]